MNYILIASFLLFNHVSIASIYSFDSHRQEVQFNYLLKELRCLVCQNQDLLDSNSLLAKDLRQEVYQLVKDGRSDSEIIEFLTNRYGDFILFNPPVRTVTLLLWFGPVLFLIIGLLLFGSLFVKRNKHA